MSDDASPEPGSPPEEAGNDQADGRAATLAHEAQPPSPKYLPRKRFLLLIAMFAVVDFLGSLLLTTEGDSWALAAAFVGTLFGQVIFLTIWAVLGPFELWARWALALGAGALIYLSCVLGVLVHWIGDDRWEPVAMMLVGMLILPLLFLLMQIPLWIRRMISGWQIVHIDEADEHTASTARQFGLAHMLGLMLMVAVSLSLTQVLITTIAPGAGEVRGLGAAQFWFGVAYYCGIPTIYVAVWAGPALRACLLARSKVRGLLALSVVWLVILLLVTIVTNVVMSFSTLGGTTFEFVLPYSLHLGALAVTLAGSLHALRACGYVMIRSRRRRTAGQRSALPEGESPFAEGAAIQPATDS